MAKSVSTERPDVKVQHSRTPREVARPFTQSIEALIGKLRPQGAVPVMTVVEELLRTHPRYLASRQLPTVARPGVMHVSPRTIDEHLGVVRDIWDSTLVPRISGRRAVLGLTLADQLLADWVVTSGVAAAIVESWSRDHARQGGEGPPYQSLTTLGRNLADALPLFRASLGGGPTWSTELEAEVAHLAWSHDKTAILAVDAEGASQLVTSAASRWAPRFPVTMIEIALPGNDANKAVGAYLDHDGGPAIYNAPGATSQVVRPQASDSVTSLALSGDGRIVWVGGTMIQRGATTAQLLVPVSDVEEGEILGASATGERCAVWSPAGSELRVIRCREPAVDGATTVSGTVEQAFRLERPAAAALSDTGTLVWGNGARIEVTIGGVQVASLDARGEVSGISLTWSGGHLAVAVGRAVHVWDLSTDRRAHQLGWYESDSLDRRDLLGRDRDVGALAALVASEVLVPPLTVGIFGAWGSGKSWFVRRLQEVADELTTSGADGYLQNVVFVEFDAWQYAETDLVASLVDRVYNKLMPSADGKPTTLKAADDELATAEAALQVATEQQDQSLVAFRRRRSRFWWLLAGLLIGVAVLVWLVAGPGGNIISSVLSVVSSVAAVLAAAVGVLHRVHDAQTQAEELVRAGRETSNVVARWAGEDQRKTAAEAVEKKEQAEQRRDTAQSRLDQLQADPVTAVLEDVMGWQEYREKLGLVSRTQERFAKLDREVRKLRSAYRAGSRPAPPNPQRVVVVIDDLDRCPAEKVVAVLEAVHLLFDTELFVVLLAVDTRWLEQSLRIRYKDLLAGEANADPRDFLEKIIQVPFHIKSLDPSDAAALVAGLAGPRSVSRNYAAHPTPSGHAADEALDQVVERSLSSPVDAGARGGDSLETSEVAVSPPVQRELDADAAPRDQTLLVPADLLQLTDNELGWLTTVSPLIGTTPRTVKRFLNTYRLLKARSRRPNEFAEDVRGVAFLLALVTGQSALADDLLAAIQQPTSPETLDRLLAGLRTKSTLEGRQLRGVQRFVESAKYGGLKTVDMIRYTDEVARFSFNRPSDWR